MTSFRLIVGHALSRSDIWVVLILFILLYLTTRLTVNHSLNTSKGFNHARPLTLFQDDILTLRCNYR